MKDKLRELAEWMRDVNGHCADALTEILDADGDGVAVAWLHEVIADDGIADLALSFEPDSFPFADVAGYQSIKHSPLYTHPARSGVVSDEECREFLCKMPLGAAHTPIEMVRAALESYERNRK